MLDLRDVVSLSAPCSVKELEEADGRRAFHSRVQGDGKVDPLPGFPSRHHPRGPNKKRDTTQHLPTSALKKDDDMRGTARGHYLVDG